MAGKQDRSNKSAASKQKSVLRKESQATRKAKPFSGTSKHNGGSISASGNPPRRSR